MNKFAEFVHEWMPGAMDSWRAAMDSVDLSHCARPNSQIWGYWVPEPAMLLRPQTVERRDRYIMTWLRLQSAWLYYLRLAHARPTSISTQWWRDVLYGPTGRGDADADSANRQRWLLIKQVFKDIFEEIHWDQQPPDHVRWFHHNITSPTADLTPKIVWELHDLGFRYELQGLDRLPRTNATRDSW